VLKKPLELAFALLREKGHLIGQSFATSPASPSGVFSGGEPSIQTEVDGVLRTQAQIIELAATYPEWRGLIHVTA